MRPGEVDVDELRPGLDQPPGEQARLAVGRAAVTVADRLRSPCVRSNASLNRGAVSIATAFW